MKLLADENMYAEIVAWLREQGHDVFWAARNSPGADDEDLLHLAHKQNRVILTNDLDFGELVIRHRFRALGVILIRLKSTCSAEVARLFARHWLEIENNAFGNFIVVSNRKLRIRPLPSSSCEALSARDVRLGKK
ncbi:MAG: DUF5615 family PIN-like protein [Candidatus Sumerlaeota bacterium]|nr:DUF5615 family PIN-like protein [Candidatus Sumerlaeota bacterium]